MFTLDAVATRLIFEFLPISEHPTISKMYGHTKHSINIVRVFGMHLPGCQNSAYVLMSARGIEAASVYSGDLKRAIILMPDIWVDDWLNYVRPLPCTCVRSKLCYASERQIRSSLSEKTVWGDYVRSIIRVRPALR